MTAGDRNWREFVGPSERWDSQAATQFTYLVQHGLRENHRLCDVGCGSLRAGRLFIPYLAEDCYYGIEPEEWLLDEGLWRHVGSTLQMLRRPRFITGRRDFPLQEFGVRFNFILAQSVLTHTDQEQVRTFLGNAAACLAEGGEILATWQEGTTDFTGKGWQYPHCVDYTHTFMRLAGKEYGLKFRREVTEVLGLKGTWGVWC